MTNPAMRHVLPTTPFPTFRKLDFFMELTVNLI
jgi:hypothetical protein